MAGEFFAGRMADARGGWKVRKSARDERRQLGVVAAGSREYACAGEVGRRAILEIDPMPSVRVRLTDATCRELDSLAGKGGRNSFVLLSGGRYERNKIRVFKTLMLLN